MKLNRGQWILVGVVTLAWLASFFIPDLTAETRVGVQAAFMLILGRIFGVGIIRNQDAINDKRNGS